MSRSISTWLLAMILVLAAPPGRAVEPDEILDDPKLEQRARKISLGLRCLVCQNQSIDDSNAPLAKDLRILVRERLKQGDTDGQVVDFVVSRYGEFVLLKPRLGVHTIALWFGPPLLLLLSVLLIYRSYRKRKEAAAAMPVAKLTPAEKRRLKKLLQER